MEMAPIDAGRISNAAAIDVGSLSTTSDEVCGAAVAVGHTVESGAVMAATDGKRSHSKNTREDGSRENRGIIPRNKLSEAREG